MDTIQATCKRQTHARGKMLATRENLREATQCGYHIITRHTYGRKDEGEEEYMIKNIVE